MTVVTAPPWLARVVEVLGPRARVDEPLGARTTYRVGGPAAVLLVVDGEADLDLAHRALVAAGGPVPVLAVGQGSNLLVADAGFPGLVLVPGDGMAEVTLPVPTAGQDGQDGPGAGGSGAGGPGAGGTGAGGSGAGGTGVEVVVRAGAAARLPVVARRSAAAGLEGLEWAVGIPGSVGGAVRMNAGGHGSDMAATVRTARVYDLCAGRADDRPLERLGFAYRRSALAAGDVVVGADLVARRGDRRRAEAAVAEVVRWRRAHQPGGANAGSVFTNPPGDAAGRLVDAAGLKGLRVGSAEVSTKHANFIQADAGGSADDVRRLIDTVRAEVSRRTGVDLVPELRMVGFADLALPSVEAGVP